MNNNGFYVSLITINDYCYTVICIYKFIVFVYNLFSPFFYALHVNATKFIFPRHYFFARDYLDYYGKSVFIGILSDRLDVQFNKKNVHIYFLP